MPIIPVTVTMAGRMKLIISIYADAAGDTDDGIWPRELVVPTIVITEPVVEPEMVTVGTRITSEKLSVLLVLRSLLVPQLSRRRCRGKKRTSRHLNYESIIISCKFIQLSYLSCFKIPLHISR